MENRPFEDIFPIKNVDIPASYVSLPFRVPITHQWIIRFSSVAEVSERVFRAVDAAQQAAEELLLETETWQTRNF